MLLLFYRHIALYVWSSQIQLPQCFFHFLQTRKEWTPAKRKTLISTPVATTDPTQETFVVPCVTWKYWIPSLLILKTKTVQEYVGG